MELHEKFYGEPLSELAKSMLHTDYIDRRKDLGGNNMKKYRCQYVDISMKES